LLSVRSSIGETGAVVYHRRDGVSVKSATVSRNGHAAAQADES
jgi:hypothetical protein